jgi:hypothetical protein
VPADPLSDSFSTTYVRNAGAVQVPTFKVVHHKTWAEVVAVVNNAANTAHPLRCISLSSYTPLDSATRKYAAVFVENTGAYFKKWYWWTNVSADFILSETDQKKKNKAHYPIRLVNISPTSHQVGEPWGFDIVAVSNTGSDAAWWWWNNNMTLDEIPALLNAHASHKPRIYQIARNNESAQNHNVWSAILVEKGSHEAYFDVDKTYDQATTLAAQRHARVVDLVPNHKLHSGNPGYAVSMVKCS